MAGDLISKIISSYGSYGDSAFNCTSRMQELTRDYGDSAFNLPST